MLIETGRYDPLMYPSGRMATGCRWHPTIGHSRLKIRKPSHVRTEMERTHTADTDPNQQSTDRPTQRNRGTPTESRMRSDRNSTVGGWSRLQAKKSGRFRSGLRRAGQHRACGQVERQSQPRPGRVPAPGYGHAPQRGGCGQGVSACSRGDLAAEALAAGHASEQCRREALAILSRRVRLPLQLTPVAPRRQDRLPALGSTGLAASDFVQCAG